MAKKFKELKRNDSFELDGIQYVANTDAVEWFSGLYEVNANAYDGSGRSGTVTTDGDTTVEEVLGDYDDAVKGNPVTAGGYQPPPGRDFKGGEWFVYGEGGLILGQGQTPHEAERNARDSLMNYDFENRPWIIQRYKGEVYYEHATEGNPGEATLHSQLSEAADHVAYEAKVVEGAANEIDDPAIAAAAEDQAEAMEDAAEALEDAAEAARETTAEVFTETGTAQDDQAAGAAGETVADAVAGNVSTIPNYGPEKFSQIHGNVAEDAASGFWYAVDETPFAPGRYEIVSGPHQDREHAQSASELLTEPEIRGTSAAVKGNPGKYEGVHEVDRVTVENLYQMTPEDEAGSVDEGGWYGLYRNRNNSGGWILTEDSQGFVDATYYEDGVQRVWDAEVGNPGEAIPGVPADATPVEAAAVELVSESVTAPAAAEAAAAVDTAPIESHWYTRPLLKGSR